MKNLSRRQFLKAATVLAGAVAAAACGFRAVSKQVTTAIAPPTASPQPGSARRELPWPEADQIVADTVVPSFPGARFTVTDERFGATGNGKTDDTAAIQSAIAACSGRGGGHVVVPAGLYSTGAIRLLSNVDLHLEKGAVIRFNGDPAAYPLVFTRYAGIECMNRSPMVYAYGETNIGLTGDGVLDAAATSAWNAGADSAKILDPLVAAGVPPEQRVVTRRGSLRTSFVQPYRCTNVLIQGVTLRQSQFWHVHPTLSRNVTVDRVTTLDVNHDNTDGCNPESCDHVVIANCTLNSNDDCIAIKAGHNADGRRVNVPSQNIVIAGCTFQTRWSGIAFGSDTTGGIRNVYVYNCRSVGKGVRYMLYVKSNTSRGGYVENIHLAGVSADSVSSFWAVAHMDYFNQTGSFPPTFKDWFISECSGGWAPQVFNLRGLPGNPIRGFSVANSQFTNVQNPTNHYSDVQGIAFDSVTINGKTVAR
jgi:polygalacturonase